MPSLNKVMIIGHLGADPTLNYTQGGTPASNFTVAASEKFKDKSGEYQERTEWFRVVAWGKLAEICSEYLTKGKLVYIEGRIQTREWEDKDGQKKFTTEVVAREMLMLGGKTEKPRQEKTVDYTHYEDDLPF